MSDQTTCRAAGGRAADAATMTRAGISRSLCGWGVERTRSRGPGDRSHGGTWTVGELRHQGLVRAPFGDRRAGAHEHTRKEHEQETCSRKERRPRLDQPCGRRTDHQAPPEQPTKDSFLLGVQVRGQHGRGAFSVGIVAAVRLQLENLRNSTHAFDTICSVLRSAKKGRSKRPVAAESTKKSLKEPRPGFCRPYDLFRWPKPSSPGRSRGTQ